MVGGEGGEIGKKTIQRASVHCCVVGIQCRDALSPPFLRRAHAVYHAASHSYFEKTKHLSCVCVCYI
jgi:hypothetical protein